MLRFVTVGIVSLVLMQGAGAQSSEGPAGSTQLEPGKYAGRAQDASRGSDLVLYIRQPNADGRFAGTVVFFRVPPPCNSEFPIIGEVLPDGVVRIDSREGVIKGCERTFTLRIAPGNQLTGTLLGPHGTFNVNVKRQ
jgi:hypothetical protein